MTAKPSDSGGFFLFRAKGLPRRIAMRAQHCCHMPVTKNQALGALSPDFAVPRVNGFISVRRKFRALIASLCHDYCPFRPRADLDFTVAKSR
jgi:hypothetical protein